jgi:hypothetical protein
MKTESYLAIPLSDTEGKVLGHLAVLDIKPMGAAPDDLSITQMGQRQACRICASHLKERGQNMIRMFTFVGGVTGAWRIV